MLRLRLPKLFGTRVFAFPRKSLLGYVCSEILHFSEVRCVPCETSSGLFTHLEVVDLLLTDGAGVGQLGRA